MIARTSRVLAAMMLALIGLLALPSFASAAGETAIVGLLKGPDGAPLVGVSVTASSEKGNVSGVSGADGSFRLDLPAGGTYEITIDPGSLPDGVAVAGDDGGTRSVLVLTGEKRVLFTFVAGEGGGGDTGGQAWYDRVPQLIADGLVLGILIALAALGLNLIFGTTGLTNFAHGELLTLGAFTAIVINELGVHIIIATPIAVVLSAILWGWGQNKILWRPLRRRRTGLIAAMIVSIGLAIALRYTLLLFFGGSPRNYQQYAGQPGIEFLGVSLTPKSLILAVVAVVLLVAATWWLQNSRIGKATRAVADNPALASATGIDVEKVIAVVWTLGAGLAAYAGIYLGLTQDVMWNMGQKLLLVIFASVTLGGLGTIYGAIVGSLVVGLFIQLSTLVLPTEMKYVGALLLMIVILLVRPQGILGRRERVG